MTQECPFSNSPITRQDLEGRKITVMGLGLFGGGLGLTEFLCKSGAKVLVTDLRDADTLRPSITPLKPYPIQWVLGQHRQSDFLHSDMVFVNPAVPRDTKILRLCREKGIPLETEMNLFFKLCEGRFCGITGSNGKTTTTSLTGMIFKQAFPQTRVGGNLGVSLLGQLENIGPDTWAVVELSSFQLEDLRAINRRPEISVVTNLSPNHLNRHGTYDNYIGAKKTILEGGDSEGWAILNGDDTIVRSWATCTKRKVLYYGRAGTVKPTASGIWLFDNEVYAATGEYTELLFTREDLALLGRFNMINAAGAAAAALAAGCTPQHILKGIQSFRPIEHRLEFVIQHAGVKFYNDSISTTPESTLCAIEALGPDMILIAGGSDKGTSFKQLGRSIAQHTRGAVLMGQTAPKIIEAIKEARGRIPVVQVSTLEEAVSEALKLAKPNFKIALSPACASSDMFTHFEERGQLFKDLVRNIPELTTH